MKVLNIANINNERQQSFTAIPLARYRTEPDTFVKIYQLEKRDLPFISDFITNINQYFKDKRIDDFAHKQVMEEAFSAVKSILSSEHTEKKVKSLLAVTGSEPCGILVGNVAKKEMQITKSFIQAEKITDEKKPNLTGSQLGIQIPIKK